MSTAAHTPMSDERATRLTEKLRRELGAAVVDLLSQDDVIEIVLNADGQLWVERLGASMERIGSMPPGQAEACIGTVASMKGVTVTPTSPILECELPLDGSRFEAILPPVVPAPVFAIRRRAIRVFSLDDYVSHGIMSAGQRDLLRGALDSKMNIVVCGGTSSGKTTLGNAMIAHLAEVAPDDRLIILEDTAEIQCRSPNAVTMQASTHVSMLQLLRATMRLRPDRIIVGEVRGPEALALLKAWNTGHPGGIATVHANNARAALGRLEALVAEVTQAPMQSTIAEAVDLVLFINKTAKGRRVEDVLRVSRFDGTDYVCESLNSQE